MSTVSASSWRSSVISLCRSNGFVFFFFSSRRRHTRCSRDWSSDVCSSDLKPDGGELYVISPEAHGLQAINTWTHEVGDTMILGSAPTRGRSEEHTSELQSRLHLVCRLLLEKKKKIHETRHSSSLMSTE